MKKLLLCLVLLNSSTFAWSAENIKSNAHVPTQNAANPASASWCDAGSCDADAVQQELKKYIVNDLAQKHSKEKAQQLLDESNINFRKAVYTLSDTRACSRNCSTYVFYGTSYVAKIEYRTTVDRRTGNLSVQILGHRGSFEPEENINPTSAAQEKRNKAQEERRKKADSERAQREKERKEREVEFNRKVQENEQNFNRKFEEKMNATQASAEQDAKSAYTNKIKEMLQEIEGKDDPASNAKRIQLEKLLKEEGM